MHYPYRRRAQRGIPSSLIAIAAVLFGLALVFVLRSSIGVRWIAEQPAPTAAPLPTAAIVLPAVPIAVPAVEATAVPQTVTEPPAAPAVVAAPAVEPPRAVLPQPAFVAPEVPASGGGSSGFGGDEETQPAIAAPAAEPTAVVPWSTGDNGSAGQWSGGPQGALDAVNVPTAAPRPNSSGGGSSGFD